MNAYAYTKLVNFPTQAYTEAKMDIPESLSLRPISPTIESLRHTFSAKNYIVEHAQIFGMSNIISNSKNLACLNNIVFNPSNIDKIIDPLEESISFEQGQFIFKPRKLYDLKEAVFIGGHWNFGHWQFNHLARLSFVPDPINENIFILPASLKKNFRDMLYEIGLNDKNLLFVEPGMLVNVEKLLIPQMPWISPSVDSALFSPGAFHKLRRLLNVALPPSHEVRGKLFLTRKNARWRRLQNEDEIFEKFEKLGFIRIDPAELNAAEQIDLGKNTQYLVSPVGANSSFFINMPVNSMMLELAPPMGSMNVSGPFARACGINFSQLEGEPIVESNEIEINYDYKIQCIQIEDAIDKFFNLS